MYRINVFLLKPYRFRGVRLDRSILSLPSLINAAPEWVTYPHRIAEPLLVFLPTILARWIVENLFDALMLPQPAPVGSNDQYISGYRDHRGMQWSTQALNSILQNVLVESGDGTQLGVLGSIEHESEFCEGTPRIRCKSIYRGAASKVTFSPP